MIASIIIYHILASEIMTSSRIRELVI